MKFSRDGCPLPQDDYKQEWLEGSGCFTTSKMLDGPFEPRKSVYEKYKSIIVSPAPLDPIDTIKKMKILL